MELPHMGRRRDMPSCSLPYQLYLLLVASTYPYLPPSLPPCCGKKVKKTKHLSPPPRFHKALFEFFIFIFLHHGSISVLRHLLPYSLYLYLKNPSPSPLPLSLSI